MSHYLQANCKVYVVGNNRSGEFGLGQQHKEHAKALILSGINAFSNNITNIYSGDNHCIYSDHDQNIWAAGSNERGECGLNINATNNKTARNVSAIKYFKENNIKISKICTSTTSQATFWITNRGKAYGNGRNDVYQLGLNHCKDQFTPILLNSLENVIDIKPSRQYTIALCAPFNSLLIILTYWLRMETIDIPTDITDIIDTYYMLNEVYSTGNRDYGANGHGDEDVKKWQKIETFSDKHIIQIDVGYDHTLFLESNGVVWSCGFNYDGQLGYGHSKSSWNKPKRIEYFIDNSIKIKEIRCGWTFNVAIDYNDRVYSWGENDMGQCGMSIRGGSIYTPQPMMIFENCKIIKIQCGVAHSYAMDDNGNHYLWGDNSDCQCLVYHQYEDDELDRILLPNIVNDILKKEFNDKVIMDICIGYDNTKIIVGA